jgi:hypothetical protein
LFAAVGDLGAGDAEVSGTASHDARTPSRDAEEPSGGWGITQITKRKKKRAEKEPQEPQESQGAVQPVEVAQTALAQAMRRAGIDADKIARRQVEAVADAAAARFAQAQQIQAQLEAEAEEEERVMLLAVAALI